MEPLDLDKGLPGTGKTDPPLLTDVLDELMAARGAVTYAEHARRFGIDSTYYWRLRTGKRSPSVKIAMRMAREAGTQVEQIFGSAA